MKKESKKPASAGFLCPFSDSIEKTYSLKLRRVNSDDSNDHKGEELQNTELKCRRYSSFKAKLSFKVKLSFKAKLECIKMLAILNIDGHSAS